VADSPSALLDFPGGLVKGIGYRAGLAVRKPLGAALQFFGELQIFDRTNERSPNNGASRNRSGVV